MMKEGGATTTVSSRGLDRHPRRVMKALKNGPVFIAKRGRSTHVSLTYEQYLALPGKPKTLEELRSVEDAEEAERS